MEFAVRIDWEAGVLGIAVRDGGPGLPAARCAAPDESGGRGVRPVRELADAFTVVDEAVGTTARRASR
ncbi:hypothetical protein ACWGDE_35330 [Streptomyces sp. NPDC054956]